MVCSTSFHHAKRYGIAEVDTSTPSSMSGLWPTVCLPGSEGNRDTAALPAGAHALLVTELEVILDYLVMVDPDSLLPVTVVSLETSIAIGAKVRKHASYRQSSSFLTRQIVMLPRA
jgi:hypothetical protein